jgi:hypothetical protein
MRSLTLAALAAAALALPAPAHAADHDFRGGCGYDTTYDVTRDGHLPGYRTWTGDIRLVVIATGTDRMPAPVVPVTDVWCELFVNGVSRGHVVDAPDGTGATAAAARFTVTARPTDVTGFCTHATIGGTPLTQCPMVDSIQVVPQEVVDAVDVALFAFYDNVRTPVEQAACPVLGGDVVLDCEPYDPPT